MRAILPSLPGLLLLLLAGCATAKGPFSTPSLVPAPVQVPQAPRIAVPEAGPVVWKLTQPVTSTAQLSRLLADALDRTVTRWEFAWADPQGRPLTGAEIDAADALAAAKARVGGPYFAGTQWKGQTRSDSVVEEFTVTIEYRFPAGAVASRVHDTDQKAAEVIAEVIKPGMGDYDKELALHDWLVNHAQYDLANFQADTVPDPEYTPYGVLVLGTGVCQSYASAFQLLADRVGLESHMVTGTGNGAPHSWNQVRVDGVWYNLDVTWDDPAGEGASPDHVYFNVDDRALAVQHRWDPNAAVPCSSQAANWFVRQGLVVHNLQELSTRIGAALARREASLVRRVEVFQPAHFQGDVLAAVKQAATTARIDLRWSVSVDEALGVVEAKFLY